MLDKLHTSISVPGRSWAPFDTPVHTLAFTQIDRDRAIRISVARLWWTPRRRRLRDDDDDGVRRGRSSRPAKASFHRRRPHAEFNEAAGSLRAIFENDR